MIVRWKDDYDKGWLVVAAIWFLITYFNALKWGAQGSAIQWLIILGPTILIIGAGISFRPRDPSIVKGTSSIWSVMFSVLAILAVVWIIALYISDPIWRWSVAGIGTIVAFASPGGLTCLHWVFSPEFRKQHRVYRRGGPPPGYSPGAPWQTTEVGKILNKSTNFYLSKETILGGHSESFQKNLKEEMYGSAAAIYAAENPLLKCRETLASYVGSFADWTVLGLKPEEKDDVLLSPYISGDLHRHMRYCAQYSPGLADFIARNEHPTDEDFVAWANARSCAFKYLMNCMNVVRADVGDFDLEILEKADWFRPFVKSMLILKEDEYRGAIGLPTLLPHGLWARHATFLKFVLEGVPDPLSHWEAVHKLKHRDVS